MALTITYDDTEDLGRVRLSFTGYSVDADYAKVERSPDQIVWTTVRGGDQVALASGVGHIDDYEFSASVTNYYRVTAVDTGTPAYIGQGTGATGNNTSVVPALPGSLNNGDLMILHAAIRNSGTGTVNLPAGWTSLVNSGNMLIAGRVKQAGDTAPTVSFTGGAANEDTIAIISNMRGVTMTGAIIPTALLNSSAQDILTPGNAYLLNDVTMRYVWKQDDCTSVAGPVGWTNVYTVNATAGNDAMISSVGVSGRTSNGTDISTVLTVTGGTSAISRGAVISFPKIAFTDQEIGNITPAVAYYRIKNPSRPSLNVRVVPTEISDITRSARTGVFDVLGRTLPVTVSDVQSSRKFNLKIDVIGYSSKDDMDNRLALGEPMFLQAPTQPGPIPTCYFVLTGDTSFLEDAKMSASYTVTLSCQEVAKPGSTVFGDTYTWNDVVTNYATWTDVIAANATWSALIDRISTNSIIVP